MSITKKVKLMAMPKIEALYVSESGTEDEHSVVVSTAEVTFNVTEENIDWDNLRGRADAIGKLKLREQIAELQEKLDDD